MRGGGGKYKILFFAVQQYCEILFTSNQSPHLAQIIWVYCDYHNMMNVILFRY